MEANRIVVIEMMKTRSSSCAARGMREVRGGAE
jgi:hypothetical protein